MIEIRERMHLPVRALARWANRAEGTLRAMEANARPIPEAFGEWFERFGKWVEKNPPSDPRLTDGRSNPLAPKRMKEIRERIHLPVRALARWTNRAEGALRAMEADARPIPEAFGDWLERLGKWVEKHPPPDPHPTSRIVITPDGRFESVTLASEHYGISRQAGWQRAADNRLGWYFETINDEEIVE